MGVALGPRGAAQQRGDTRHQLEDAERQAERLGLGDHLLLGRGEEKTGGRRKQALLADGYEALIAAIYLDGGIEPARAFIMREFSPQLDEVHRHGVSAQDYKSTLQEWLQSRDLPLPEYRLAGSLGPDHRKLFEIDGRAAWKRELALAQAGALTSLPQPLTDRDGIVYMS